MANRPGFPYAPQRLREFAQSVLDAARRGGASGCECDVSEGYGLSVTVRKGEPETIEHNRDKSIGVSVYAGERPKARRGHASTSDFSNAAIAQTVEAALAIGRRTAEDGVFMQRDVGYSPARVPGDLADAQALGRYAGERALARLGARKIPTRRAPGLFEAPGAAQLGRAFG